MGCGSSQYLESELEVGTNVVEMARKQASKRSLDAESSREASSFLARLVSRRQSLVKVDIGDSQVSTGKRSSSAAGRSQVEKTTDETLVFESYQQLCRQIVVDKLFATCKTRRNVLCLFMFGSQGSSMGELAFELVEHSALMDELQCRQAKSCSQLCPLYHTIDVASLVACNIDQRICQYNELKRAATSRKTRRKVSRPKDSFSPTRQPEDTSLSSLHSSEDNTSEYSLHDNTLDNSIAKLSISDNRIGDSSTLTLDTKQRSMLQLKLVKYFNSVSSKWMLDLLQAEVERLETDCQQNFITKPRVYLINLIPTQLTLFKSCLYLKQTLALKEFVFPYTSIKFEKRTNLRMLKKERIAKKRASSKKQRDFKLRLALFRLSFNRRKFSDKTCKDHEEIKEVPGIFLNDKLEPSFNEFFEDQFKNINKLIKVRYNPTYRSNDSIIEQNRLPCGNSAPDTDNSDIKSFQGITQHLSEISSATLGIQRPHSIIGLNYTSDALTVSDTFGPLLSPSQASIVSASLNSLGPSEDGHSSLSRWPTLTGADIANKTKIPWAVELQLINKKAKHLSLENFLHQRQEKDSEMNSSYEGIVYSEELRHSSSSPASFILASLGRHRHQQYRLMPTKFVTNETDQTTSVMFEAKHMSNDSSVKLRNQTDIGRIAKRIKRAKYLVSYDSQNWLCDAVAERHKRSISPEDNRKGLHKPELVVYVIPIDIHCIDGSKFKLSASKLNNQMTLNRAIVHQVPSSLEAPLESPLASPVLLKAPSADCKSPSNKLNKGLRHVQFKLQRCQLELSEFDDMRAHHRYWLEDHVFVSWPVGEVLDIERSNTLNMVLSILATTLDQ